MAEGREFKEVIKVGFCNYYTEEKCERYKEFFDIVVDGREGWEVVKGLVGGIIGWDLRGGITTTGEETTGTE